MFSGRPAGRDKGDCHLMSSRLAAVRSRVCFRCHGHVSTLPDEIYLPYSFYGLGLGPSDTPTPGRNCEVAILVSSSRPPL